MVDGRGGRRQHRLLRLLPDRGRARAGRASRSRRCPRRCARTTLGELARGRRRSTSSARCGSSERLGGHLVQGHVDGVGDGDARCAPRATAGASRSRCPPELRRFVAEKGSLAVDGVSLTVARAHRRGLRNRVHSAHAGGRPPPGGYAAGRRVNLEVDLLARYLARLLGPGRPEGPMSDAPTQRRTRGRDAARASREPRRPTRRRSGVCLTVEEAVQRIRAGQHDHRGGRRAIARTRATSCSRPRRPRRRW